MLLILGALVAGVVLGLVLRGSLRNLGHLRFRWWGLAFVAVGLQFAPIPSISGRADEWLGIGLLVASYVAVALFVAANIRVPGVLLIAAGFALNLVAISLNGGMPVSDAALRVAYGPEYRSEREALIESGGRKHHLARADDVAEPLTDVIPVGWPVREVLSVGDIVWLLGTVWLVAGAMRNPGPVPSPTGLTPARNGDGSSRREERDDPQRGRTGRRLVPPP